MLRVVSLGVPIRRLSKQGSKTAGRVGGRGGTALAGVSALAIAGESRSPGRARASEESISKFFARPVFRFVRVPRPRRRQCVQQAATLEASEDFRRCSAKGRTTYPGRLLTVAHARARTRTGCRLPCLGMRRLRKYHPPDGSSPRRPAFADPAVNYCFAEAENSADGSTTLFPAKRKRRRRSDKKKKKGAKKM